MKFLWSLLTHWPCLVLEYSRKWKRRIPQVPTRPEMLGVIQYYNNVTHTTIRTTIHALQTKYTWKGLYQDVEDYVCKNLLSSLYSDFLLYLLDQNLSRMSKECPLTTSASARVATNISA